MSQHISQALGKSRGSISIAIQSINTPIKLDPLTNAPTPTSQSPPPPKGKPFMQKLTIAKATVCIMDPMISQEQIEMRMEINRLIEDISGDLVGLIPVVGTVTDIARSFFYMLEGRVADSLLTGVGAIPIAGDTVQLTKLGIKGKKMADLIAKLVKFLEKHKESRELLDEAKEIFSKVQSVDDITRLHELLLQSIERPPYTTMVNGNDFPWDTKTTREEIEHAYKNRRVDAFGETYTGTASDGTIINMTLDSEGNILTSKILYA
jgi:uncharacterized protein with ATP-grasp and redox domains